MLGLQSLNRQSYRERPRGRQLLSLPLLVNIPGDAIEDLLEGGLAEGVLLDAHRRPVLLELLEEAWQADATLR